MARILENNLKTIFVLATALMLGCSKPTEEVTTTFDRANNLVGIWKVVSIDPSEPNCNFGSTDNSLYYFSSDRISGGDEKRFQYSYNFSPTCWGNSINNSTLSGGNGVFSGGYTLINNGTEMTMRAGSSTSKIIIYSMTADKMVWLVLKDRTSVSQITLNRAN